MTSPTTRFNMRLDQAGLGALTGVLTAAVRLEINRLCGERPTHLVGDGRGWPPDNSSPYFARFDARLEQVERMKGLLDLVRSAEPAAWGRIGWCAAPDGGGVLVWTEADRPMLRTILLSAAQTAHQMPPFVEREAAITALTAILLDL